MKNMAFLGECKKCFTELKSTDKAFKNGLITLVEMASFEIVIEK